MSRMKEGEEEKTKSYSALIWTEKAVSNTDLEFLGNIKVSLSTPLNVCEVREFRF